LSGNRGTWTSTATITYAYSWQRCDTSGGNCAAIGGATSTSYTVTSADLGNQLRFAVTATNTDGKTSQSSNPTSTVTTATGEPANSVAPAITGTPTVGTALTASTGTWTGDQPMTYSYQWQSCDSAGNSCASIPSATKSAYTVSKNNVGDTLRVRVTATNSRGDGNAISVATAVAADATSSGGIIDIGGGGKSAAVGSVVAGQRLIVKSVTFNPNPVTSRSKPITVKVTVTDTRGYYIRGAMVFIRSTPLLTETPADQQTGTDGTTTFTITPQSNFPLKTGYNVQFFVKAYQTGDDPLAGVSGTRLVQVATSG
jgi:hypothetical protein